MNTHVPELASTSLRLWSLGGFLLFQTGESPSLQPASICWPCRVVSPSRISGWWNIKRRRRLTSKCMWMI